MDDLSSKFQEAMRNSGLICPELPVANTETFQRFGMVEDKGKKPCWYILTILSDNFAIGAFGCFKRDINETWCSRNIALLSQDEQSAFKSELKKIEAKHKLEQQEYWNKGAEKADNIWLKSKLADNDHEYLKRKRVKSFGLHVGFAGDLIIPILDNEKKTHGLQFIAPDGQKKFLSGTNKKGHYFFIAGNNTVIYIAEGYATAASIYQATGNTAVVAFDAGNLLLVSQTIRMKYPRADIVFSADNDRFNEKNIGVEKATEAARVIGAKIVAPQFKNLETKPTDFNDLMLLEGLEEVRKQLVNSEEVHNISAKDANNHIAFQVHYIVKKGGVFFQPPDKDEEVQKEILVCSQLNIVARTRDEKNLSHGRLLEFRDADEVLHRWAMPMEMLATDGAEYRRILLSMGLNIPANRKSRELLTDYLQSSRPKEIALCTDSMGWHKNAFVFPRETFGLSDVQVYLQTTYGFLEGFEIAGSLEDWKENIGKFCKGNSRLIFAVSAAFAAPLLYLLGEENGGFHFRGASSSGKTTALKVACSIWGDQTRLQRWRATSNGLEGIAKLHNDCLLCLDELAQVDPKEAGEVAYMLANGAGKIRSKQDGTVRQKAFWRLLFLSAGEISLADHMQSIGKKVKAGQEVRLIDITSDAGSNLGLFENLHDFENGDTFSRHLIQASNKYYGTAIRGFLKHIVKDQDNLVNALRVMVNDFIAEVIPSNSDGQVKRGVARFAIVAAAGDLATKLGITGWQDGSAIEGTKRCFNSWISTRGGHSDGEATEALQQVRSFFQLHSESRFSKWENSQDSNKLTINRAGFSRCTHDTIEFFVETEIFRNEICKGLDHRFVAKTCIANGWLVPDGNDKSTKSMRMPDTNKTRRVYHFSHLVIGDDYEK